jgi:hypothetical protein
MYLNVPSTERAALSQLENHLGLRPARPARLVPFGPKGLCYWNCDRYIEQRGGKIVYGWQVQGVPNLFFRLMHHAVVRVTSGQLIDPTEFNGATKGKTTIILDDRITPPRDYPAFVQNQYFQLPNGQESLERCRQAEEHQLALYRQTMAVARAAGIPWVPGEGLDLARLPAAVAVMEQLEEAAKNIDRAHAFTRAAQDALTQ